MGLNLMLMQQNNGEALGLSSELDRSVCGGLLVQKPWFLGQTVS